jgi:hypothetical protein
VNLPYPTVRDLLREGPIEILQRATASGSSRADALAATLRYTVGGFELGVDVRVHVKGYREEEGVAGLSPVLRIDLGWEASRAAAFFPSMRAQLSAWPLSTQETQLELEGEYRPPLGAVGKAADAAILHRVAEAAVHRFLEDLVEQLRREGH